MTYSKEFTATTAIVDAPYIKVDVTRGKDNISAIITANDPLTKLALRKDGFDKELKADTSEVIDGIYTYAFQIYNLEEAPYYIVAETKQAKEETFAGTGRLRFNYNKNEIEVKPGEIYYFSNGKEVRKMDIDTCTMRSLNVYFDDDKDLTYLNIVSKVKYSDNSTAFTIKYSNESYNYTLCPTIQTGFYKVK